MSAQMRNGRALSMAAQPFILTVDSVRLFCYPDDILKETNRSEFGIRSRGRIPKKTKRFSTTPILRLSNRKSLTRCRKSDSSDTGERQRVRAVRFRVWCSALIADRNSITQPPTTLKSGRTFSSAPRTEPTRTSAADTIFVPSFWRTWSGNT